MKLITVFLILGMSIGYAGNTYSQSTKIDLNIENKTIKDVFDEIEKNSEYIFLYNNATLDADRIISITSKSETIYEVMDKLFSGTDNTYRVSDRQVYISRVYDKDAVGLKTDILVPEQQNRTITGTVRDDKGETIIGANVIEVGTTNGTVTDLDGNFTLEVKDNAVIQISYIGFIQKTIETKGKNNFEIVLNEDSEVLEEVVVTALGIEREKKALGYSVQQVEGAALTQIPTSNLMQNLTGKVAGLTVYNQLGTFEAPRFNIRGSSNILIIVDGVPGYDAWAINPENIESIDVIKGATGAALYGAQGTDGVIMITTKKGAGSDRGVSIDISSNSMFQAGYLIIPEFQNKYGQGMNGQYSYVDGKGTGINDGVFQNWGPKLNEKDPRTESGFVEIPQYNSPIDPETGKRIPLPWMTRTNNPIKDFLKPSLTTSNTLTVGGDNNLGNFRLSLNSTYKEGQAPNTSLFNNHVQFSGGYNFTDKIYIDASVAFNQLYSDNYETANYNWQNYMLIIGHDFPANVSMDDLKDYWVEGKEGYVQKTWVENRNNPYWQLNERTQKYERNKLVGWIRAQVDFTEHLKLMGRVNLAHTSLNSEYRENIGNNMIGSDGKGQFSKNMSSNFDINSDFLLTYNNRTSNDMFGFDITVGGSSRVLKNDGLDSKISALVIPGLYNLSNRQGEYISNNAFTKKIVNSLYSTATIDYARALYLTVTARNDWSSALSLNNNSYFYPSFSLSTILNEYIPMPDFVTFAKLRGSWARGRQDTSPYWNSAVYSISSWSNDNVPMANHPSLLYTDNLKAQQLDTYEVGLDLRLLKNRLGFDVAYYHKSLTDMITTVPISQASGFSNRQINGREIITKGYEFAINGKPILAKNFNWNVQVNMGLWKDYLGKLAPGETKYQGFYREGERIGTWRGRVFERSPEGDIIYEGGLPLWASKPARGGFLDPDLTFGIINTFNYKNWSATIQLDGRLGGFMYNYQYSTMMYRGTNVDSAIGDIREKKWVGNGVKVVSGEVIRDAYDNIIYDTRVFEPNDVPVNYYDWVNRYYNGVYEVNMYDNTFLKLREINIGYNLRNQWLKTNLMVNNIYMALVGQNLWVYSRIPYSDPDRGNTDNGQGPTPRMIGFNLKINF